MPFPNCESSDPTRPDLSLRLTPSPSPVTVRIGRADLTSVFAPLPAVQGAGCSREAHCGALESLKVFWDLQLAADPKKLI
jgi:hypothetical protein